MAPAGAKPNVARVFASDANFLLVECRDAQKFYAAAQSVGLIVRDFTQELHENQNR